MLSLVGMILFGYVLYELYQYFFPAPLVDPEGKYVLISGCDSGFGNGLAVELDRQGFHVLAAVYDQQNQAKVQDQLSSRATVFPLDVTRKQDIESALKLVKQKTNSLYALVNNAGVISSGHIDWITLESIRQVMEINFFGHVAMTKTFLPLLIVKRHSRVINVCSVAGFLGSPSTSAYCASKFALESFSDCLRREMAVWKLHVSIIEPGIMRTPIIEKHGLGVRELAMQMSQEVKERWGLDFLSCHFEKVKNNPLLKLAEDPSKVVRAMQHAVSSTAPRIRYRPGWQSKFVFFPLAMLPAWLSDIYFVKTRTLPVQPAGLRKQLVD